MTDVAPITTRIDKPARIERSRLSPTFWRAIAVFGAALFVLALLGRIMDFGIRRDEMLFAAPAVLLGQANLYSDFFYNHLPYSAWLFRGSYLVFGDLGLLASARLIVFMGWMLLLGAAIWGVWRLSSSALLGAFAGVALATNETLLGQAGMAASNNLLPLAFGVLALAVFLNEILRERPRILPLFCVGLCLSIATGMKISAVVVIPPMVIAAFLMPRALDLRTRIHRVVLPALVGGLVGALPLFVYLATDPAQFMAHITGFHTGPHVAYWEAFRHTEPDLAMTLHSKILMAYHSWLSGSALLIAVAIVAAGWLVSTSENRLRGVDWGPLILIIGVVAITVAMSFVPTPAFPQYYAAPVVFLPFLAALLVRSLDRPAMAALIPALVAGMCLMTLLALPRLASGLLALHAPAQTEVAQFDRGGQAIAAILQDKGLNGPVATLMPLYPLEEELAVYPELATGQFAYRAAPFIGPELANHYVMVSPDGLNDLFAAKPPAAFLLGYEPTLEAPMRAYADAHGYQPVAAHGLSNRYGDGVLLIARGEVGE